MLRNCFSAFLFFIFINAVFSSAFNLNSEFLSDYKEIGVSNNCENPSSLPEEEEQDLPCPIESPEPIESKESSEFKENYDLPFLASFLNAASSNGILFIVTDIPFLKIFLAIFSPPPELNSRSI